MNVRSALVQVIFKMDLVVMLNLETNHIYGYLPGILSQRRLGYCTELKLPAACCIQWPL